MTALGARPREGAILVGHLGRGSGARAVLIATGGGQRGRGEGGGKRGVGRLGLRSTTATTSAGGDELVVVEELSLEQ